MTFNDDVRVDTGKVSRRRGARGGVIAGGGIGVVVVLFLASQLLGVDLTPFAQMLSGTGTAQEQESVLEDCSTGADANEDVECRMAAASDALDRYWMGEVDGYRAPADVVLFSSSTNSGCGAASAAVGPFYCPADESIYLDVAFFDTLRSDYGASGGSLAQMYVLAHEWGHHISNLTGSFASADRSAGADAGSVRLELQADCFAGAWVQNASTVTDDQGIPFLKPVTGAEIADALDAAATVGDDHIMEQAGRPVDPDAFTHGSSEQRQRWFMTGYERGPSACSTFDVPAAEL